MGNCTVEFGKRMRDNRNVDTWEQKQKTIENQTSYFVGAANWSYVFSTYRSLKQSLQHSVLMKTVAADWQKARFPAVSLPAHISCIIIYSLQVLRHITFWQQMSDCKHRLSWSWPHILNRLKGQEYVRASYTIIIMRRADKPEWSWFPISYDHKSLGSARCYCLYSAM